MPTVTWLLVLIAVKTSPNTNLKSLTALYTCLCELDVAVIEKRQNSGLVSPVGGGDSASFILIFSFRGHSIACQHSNETRLEPRPANTTKATLAVSRVERDFECSSFSAVIAPRVVAQGRSALRTAPGKKWRKKKETSNQFSLQARVSGLPSNVFALLCWPGVCTRQNSVESCEYQRVWDIDQQPCSDLHMTDVTRKHNSPPRCKDWKEEKRTSVKLYFHSRGSSSCVKTDTQLCDLFFFSFSFSFFLRNIFHMIQILCLLDTL